MKTNGRFRAYIVWFLSVAGIAIVFAVWWKQQSDLSRVRREYGQLQEQFEGLQRNLATSRAEPGSPVAPGEGVPQVASKETGVAEIPPDAAPVHPMEQPPVPEPNRLTLEGTEVNTTSEGLVTTLRFSPSKTDPLGVLALVIRLPRDGDASILDLAPVGSTAYSDVSHRVSEDGKFAIFQGTLGESTDVEFALSVSGSATADIRGTCGIEAFQLDIQSTGASVQGR